MEILGFIIAFGALHLLLVAHDKYYYYVLRSVLLLRITVSTIDAAAALPCRVEEKRKTTAREKRGQLEYIFTTSSNTDCNCTK